MYDNKVPVEEVKRFFLLVDAGKGIVKRKKELGLSGMKEEYEKILEELQKLNGKELTDRIIWDTRREWYDSMIWYKGEKPLSDMGIWPLAKDLDFLLTNESPIESAKIIKSLSYEELRELAPEEEIKRHASIRSLIDFVYPNFPLIILPKGTVRKGYNGWAKEHNKPLCTKFPEFDIGDGSSRAIAYALEELEKVPVYFGMKPLLS